ncbi:HNH endonuclease [Acidovorax sp. SUPP2539]|uniref:HNH endonuclease n=1 Tax=Acidovorax sp. SUPP2539 TaxID=2920878 RepID=UPI0023DE1C48|nr:HNH endonuclease [Acidovorax sp. SUPP2539]GKS91181.1 hypothetical protein AVTE2539_17470 [Acidovorax sp. SUPP2539]
MTERPILFSGPMVRALLDGSKTLTRRAIKPQPENDPRKHHPIVPYHNGQGGWNWVLAATGHGTGDPFPCPYGQPGDRLWVKHAANLFPVYFKPISGWEGIYAAGTDGVIYRMDRGDPKPLTPSPNSKGYHTVCLSRGARETHAVHRLVCESFYGPPPTPGAQVRHLDCDRANSTPANLDWGTHADNWQDRKGHGGGMGEAHHAAKLDGAAVAEIRSSALSQRDLARKFGVSQATVSDARLGKTWGEHQCGERNEKPFSLWKSPIHMPRWASRILLEITDVRVERLQDISEADAQAEGTKPIPDPCDHVRLSCADIGCSGPQPYRVGFRSLWQEINGPDSWDTDPWVWVVTFRRTP